MDSEISMQLRGLLHCKGCTVLYHLVLRTCRTTHTDADILGRYGMAWDMHLLTLDMFEADHTGKN